MSAAAGTAGQPGSFTLTLPGAGEERRVLSVWEVRAEDELRSFAPGADAPPEPIWRVALPGDLAAARRALVAADAEVIRSSSAQRSAFGRLNQVSQEFSTPGAHTVRGPEALLVAGLREAESQERVSFETVSGQEEGVLEQTLAWFRTTWSSMRPLFVSHSWVETTVGSERIARTAMSRSGDLMNAWKDDVTAAQGALHARAVELAYRSRAEVLRGLALAIRGAVLLGGVLVSPGTALLAIPAVWRYLNDVREQLTA